jgi:hypothetical protein
VGTMDDGKHSSGDGFDHEEHSLDKELDHIVISSLINF